MSKFAMKITAEVKSDEMHRLLISVNGHEVDVMANQDGLSVSINNGKMLLTDCGVDWPEQNENMKGEEA